VEQKNTRYVNSHACRISVDTQVEEKYLGLKNIININRLIKKLNKSQTKLKLLAGIRYQIQLNKKA